MIHGIDHIVIISADLDSAIANAQEAGFTVVPGGTHADGATHNALIAFADGSYIELISPTATGGSQQHRWFPRLEHGGGLVDMCLFSDDLVADVARIAEAGRAYIGPVDNGRARPDGEILKWKGAFPPGAVGETGWPFLIEDVTPRGLRVPEAPDQVAHENHALGIAGVTVVTNDLQQTVADMEAIADRPAHVMTSPLDDAPLGAFIYFDNNWIMVTQPTAGAGLHHLETHGPGPYAVTIRTHTGPITPGEEIHLNPDLFSGAHLELT